MLLSMAFLVRAVLTNRTAASKWVKSEITKQAIRLAICLSQFTALASIVRGRSAVFAAKPHS
jgi:hypothetical protein